MFNPPTVGSERLRYEVDFSQAVNHLAQVSVWVPITSLSPIEIAFPVWTPGSYMVREYTRNIESINANHVDSVDSPAVGPAVELSRVGKNRWQAIPPQSNGWLCVSYSLYCRENSVRTNWLDADYGFITGAATFPWVTGRQETAIEIYLHLLEGWHDTATSLQQLRKGTGEAVYLADSYDQLVDSPIVCGNFQSVRFELSGKTHYLVNVAGGDLWDLSQAAQDIQQIMAQQHQFWGEVPYPHYWILNLCTEAGGGLEHDDSTVLMCGRWAMQKRESYVDWLGLVSHEFFHTWNVRRLRPKELMVYDYESEQHIQELWIAEGVTSYLDDLFVVRSGVCTVDEYLQRLSKTILSVQSSPGRLVQSLAKSSWDAWVKLYRPDENSPNSRISYYLKGALVAWLLDVQLRLFSDNHVSLDDCMRRLWQRFRQTGYTHADFADIVQQLSNAETRQWLDEQIYGTSELDFEPALRFLGLQFQSPDPCAPTGASESIPAIGCETAMVDGRTVVRRVTRGSAAERAGINVDDELLALDDFRITADLWPSRVARLCALEPRELLVSRRGKVRRLQLQLVDPPEPTWKLQLDAAADSRARQAWLGGCS